MRLAALASRTAHRLHHHHRTDRPPFAEVQHVAEVQQVAGAGRGVGKLRDRRCRRKLAVADERIFGHGSRLVHSAAFIFVLGLCVPLVCVSLEVS